MAIAAIPDHLLSAFTENGLIGLERFYIDDTNNGEPTHYSFSKPSLLKMITKADSIFNNINKKLSIWQQQQQQQPQQSSSTVDLGFRFPKEDWLYYTLAKNHYQYANQSIQQQQVAVIGTMIPWVECAALSLGASTVYTFEYNHLTYDHPQLKAVSADQFPLYFDCESTYQNTFSAIFAISSLDHDGLGRYGDPLHPKGDIESIARIADLLTPGGLLFLTVPIGPDVVVFNLLRRYGNIRLPLLLEASGLEVIDRIAWDEKKLFEKTDYRRSYEPVLVLQKKDNYISKRCLQQQQQQQQQQEL